jgi:ATP-dependent DNA helicase RecG
MRTTMEDNIIITNLLKLSESERLEFKASIDKNNVAKVITSFINTKGGDLVIGINDDKTISDIHITEQDRKNIETFLINEIKPTAPIFSRIETYKKKNVMLISVWEGANKPYYFKNTIYTRRGAEAIVSKGAGIDNLLDVRKSFEQRWERQAVLGATFDDLDLVEVKKSLEAYKNYATDTTIIDSESFLINRGLIINGNITNACMVLFGNNPTRFIPQSRIKLVVHPGSTSGDTFIENMVFEKNIFYNIESILTQFDSIIGKEIKIEGAFRTEKKRYPEKALREGLLNAIVHRDYGNLKGFLTISIYSDRLLIANYGGLPEELTVKDLKTEHNSILRNPDIAQMCFYRRYIEMLGTGTLRMIRECKSEGFKTPVWKSKDNILELTYSGVNHQYEGVNEGVNEGVKLNIEGVNEGVNEELTLLYNQIAKFPGKKANELNEQINKSLSTTERYLKILKEQGFIEFIGAPKTGGYHLLK